MQKVCILSWMFVALRSLLFTLQTHCNDIAVCSSLKCSSDLLTSCWVFENWKFFKCLNLVIYLFICFIYFHHKIPHNPMDAQTTFFPSCLSEVLITSVSIILKYFLKLLPMTSALLTVHLFPLDYVVFFTSTISFYYSVYLSLAVCFYLFIFWLTITSCRPPDQLCSWDPYWI